MDKLTCHLDVIFIRVQSGFLGEGSSPFTRTKKKGLVKASPFFDFIRSYGTNEISSMLELVFSDKTEFSTPARQDFAISTYMRKTEAL